MSDASYDDIGFGSVKFQKRWSKEEDERLKNAINLFGETSWKTVSDYVETRDNSKSFFKRKWNSLISDCSISFLFFQCNVANVGYKLSNQACARASGPMKKTRL